MDWRMWLRCGVVVCITGCGGDDDTGASAEGTGSTGEPGSTSGAETGMDETGEPITFCDGPTALRYDPVAGGLDLFPDDFYTVDDPGSPTGLRVNLVPGDNVVVSGAGMSFLSVFDAASTLDGFGTTAGLYFTFDAGIDPASIPDTDSPSATDPVLVVDLDAGTLVPFEWEVVAEGDGSTTTSLIIEPMVPLRPTTRYGVAVTQELLDAGGNCVAPSAVMRALLEGTPGDPELDPLAVRVGEVVDALVTLGAIGQVEELSGVMVLTTQSTVDDSTAIATDIRGQTFAYTSAGGCVDTDPMEPFLTCEGSFDAGDYRDGAGVVSPDRAVQATYTLPITTYLPKTGTAPFPTIIYGHGLTGARDQAGELARFSAPAGFATIAIDAPKHGDHPDGSTGINPAFDFFGLSLNLSDPLDALVLRDNWRQGAYDKLQLLELLKTGIDVDEDLAVDLDAARLQYLGVSLGGIMGPEFLAFAPEIGVAALLVPGARVTGMVRDGETFAPVINIFAGMATDGEIARFFPIVQTVVDRGDAGSYAPWVVADRLPGFDGGRPQTLMQMVIDDDTVPNSTNRFMARALGVPHVGEVLRPIGVIEVQDLPQSANIDAETTAGVFQFDIIAMDEPASHSNLGRSEVAQEQILHFIDTFLVGGPAEIIDPYVTLGIK